MISPIFKPNLADVRFIQVRDLILDILLNNVLAGYNEFCHYDRKIYLQLVELKTKEEQRNFLNNFAWGKFSQAVPSNDQDLEFWKMVAKDEYDDPATLYI